MTPKLAQGYIFWPFWRKLEKNREEKRKKKGRKKRETILILLPCLMALMTAKKQGKILTKFKGGGEDCNVI